MRNSETAADFATDLYSHIDSSGGDYHEIFKQLDNCNSTESIESIYNDLETVDTLLEEAFNTLEELLDNSVEYDDGHAEFTEDVEVQVSEISERFTKAENTIEDALSTAESVDTEAVCSDFKFGAHTTVESAVRYLFGDVSQMNEISTEIEQRY